LKCSAKQGYLNTHFQNYWRCRCPEVEPKTWLKFRDLDKNIRELRAMLKQHPQWFEVPKLKSDKGRNFVDYSVK